MSGLPFCKYLSLIGHFNRFKHNISWKVLHFGGKKKHTAMWNWNCNSELNIKHFLSSLRNKPPHCGRWQEVVLHGHNWEIKLNKRRHREESWSVLTVAVERMERYFGAVLHTDLVAGLHFKSAWSSSPLVSSTTAARSPNAWCTTDFCRWCLREKCWI